VDAQSQDDHRRTEKPAALEAQSFQVVAVERVAVQEARVMRVGTGVRLGEPSRWWTPDEVEQAIAAGHRFYIAATDGAPEAQVNVFHEPETGEVLLRSGTEADRQDALELLSERQAEAASAQGLWHGHGLSQVLAVHAALLPNGKVVYFSGSEHDEEARRPFETTRLWDPATNAVEQPAPRSQWDDLFCCGHTLLPDGRLLAAGGTATYDKDTPPGGHQASHHYTGTTATALFDWRDERRWLDAPNMAGGRWYPTCITLPDGRALTISGHPEAGAHAHENTSVEFFDPSAETWSRPVSTMPPLDPHGFFLDFLVPQGYYPRLHVLPDGSLFSSTALKVENGEHKTRAILLARQPPTVRLTVLAEPPHDEHVYAGANFSSVLLPLRPPEYRARVLICGGKRPRQFDLGDRGKGWHDAGTPRPYDKRAYVDTVLLPDGSVLLVNGATSERQLQPPFLGGLDRDAVTQAERYDPITGQWQTLASSGVSRVYHSVALLLPDGRVWVAGSNHDSLRNKGGFIDGDPGKGDARELRIQTFSPPYLFRGPRPQITSAPLHAGYGAQVKVRTPQAQTVSRVALVRCASVTHAYNPDQRYVELSIAARTRNSVTVATPPRAALAPPGYYMLFLLNGQGVPSVGHILRLHQLKPHDAEFVKQSGVPGTVAGGAEFTATITMRNVGTRMWETDGYRLGSVDDNPVWGSTRVSLPRRVRPNREATFTITARAPRRPGTYVFRWRMLQEGVEWFGERSLAVAVTVRLPAECRQFEAEIAALTASIRRLQEELRNAAPQDKPALIAAIREANAERAAAQRALDACIAGG
jgi:hypothetical protein